MQTYPSGYGARLLSECALHAQVRTLPSACILPKVTSDGIEPPLSDLESEVLPLHHEALQPLDPRSNTFPLSHATRMGCKKRGDCAACE